MAKKIKETEVMAEAQEQNDMIDLVGVIKSEMDDAKDFTSSRRGES